MSGGFSEATPGVEGEASLRRDEIRVVDLVEAIVARRAFLLAFTFVVALATAVVSLLLPAWYTSETTIFGPEEINESRHLMTTLRSLSIPGVRENVSAQSPETFLAILESRRLRERVIERFELTKAYRVKSVEAALRDLNKHTTVKIENTGVIRVTVEDRHSQKAAAIANAMVEELDKINVELRIYKARRARQHLEQQLADVRDRLAVHEDSLARFQEENLAVSIDDQARAAVEAAAQLEAKLMELRIKRRMIEDYSTPSNPELVAITREIQAVEGQLNRFEQSSGAELTLANLPSVGLRLGRLLREVKVGEALLALLTEDYEQSRLEEAKETPVVQVLDPAMPAERRSRPKRTIMVACAVTAAGLLAIAIIVAAERWTVLATPADRIRWSRILARIRLWPRWRAPAP